MFGYININKPELKVKEYYEFKAFYCGLCHTLERKFGPAGQLSLSYDMTFVAMLLTSLYEPDVKEKKSVCPSHPFKQREYVLSPYMDYAADMNMLLAMKHFKDDWLDDKSIKAKIDYEIMKKLCKNVYVKYPRQWTAIENELRIIGKYEKENCEDAEKLSSCFGRLFGEVFVCKDDVFKEDLRAVGFYLGKFIYLMDAYEDLAEDIKNNDFNPFIKSSVGPDFHSRIYDMLLQNMTACSETFERLPLERDVNILRNIIYSGVWNHYNKMKKAKEKETET